MNGPFDTEKQARDLPAVQAVYAAFRAAPGTGKMEPLNHRMLCEALGAAGVELGAYDHQIALWLATGEPQTVAIIAAWVTRAATLERQFRTDHDTYLSAKVIALRRYVAGVLPDPLCDRDVCLQRIDEELTRIQAVLGQRADQAAPAILPAADADDAGNGGA